MLSPCGQYPSSCISIHVPPAAGDRDAPGNAGPALARGLREISKTDFIVAFLVKTATVLTVIALMQRPATAVLLAATLGLWLLQGEASG